MDCTPDSAVHPQRAKKHLSYGSSSDSGFCDAWTLSGKTGGAKYAPFRFMSSEEYNETPKENTPKKERCPETPRLPETDLKQPVGLCETPKVSKKGSSFRRRLMCQVKSTADAKTEVPRPTWACTKVPEASLKFGTQHSVGGSSESPDGLFGTLSSVSLKPELDRRSPLSTRKRRLFFAQVRTSTHEYGRNVVGQRHHQANVSLSSDPDLNDSLVSSGRCPADPLGTPRSEDFLLALERDDCQTPVNMAAAVAAAAASPRQSVCVLNTPSAALTPTYVRSLSEDSGFGSAAHDKSQDSSGDNEGSFQEPPPLSSSAPRASGETLHLSDGKRRSRLQRQQRLSTLREGGSQSEEDSRSRSGGGRARSGGDKRLSLGHSPCKADEVFLVADATPSGSTGLKLANRTATPLGVISAKQDTAATPLRTPLRTPVAKRDTPTGNSAAAAGRNATPLRTPATRPDSLLLTPAVQLVHAMCLRKASMMPDQSPSFEQELRSAAALVETPVAFRTSMPLAGLIGRKIGAGQLDVLTELKKRNLGHVLAVILGHLTPADVHSFGQVSASWNEIVGQDRRASGRRRTHLSQLEAALEQGGTVHVTDAETRLTLAKRAVLGSVQAQSRSFTYCTPQSAKGTLTPSQLNTSHSGGSSGGGSSKREKFLQVAKTLFSDECLKPCPRCQHPAKCHPVRMEGVCSRADCSFQFCTACLCAFHGARECLSRSAGRRGQRRDLVAPGSAQSKRNLRRL